MFEAIRNLSISGALLVLVGVMAATAALQYVVRLRPFGHLFKSDGAAASYVGMLTYFFTLLFGLVAVQLWQHQTSAEKNVISEANHIRILAELANLLPGDKTVLMNSLGDYVEGVTKKEWPMMLSGQQPEMFNASPELDNVRASIADLAPHGAADLVTYSAMLDRYGKIVEARQQRLLDSSQALPSTMLTTLILGAIFLWACSFLIDSGRLHTQALQSAICGGYLFLLIYLIMVLDNPFVGSWHIDATAYKRVLDVLQ